MPDLSSGTVLPPSRDATGHELTQGRLPKPLTSFIGRERELAQAKQLLQSGYLVTLTGPGGSGKTRLCMALAAAVAGEFPDGVYFVPLAPVRDPGLVPSTIAQSIGLQDARDRPLMEHLVSQLRERQVLIVLDNFEHLLAAAPVVSQLLQQTTTLRILVSSRCSLRVSGEQECPVPPLAVPDLGTRPTPESLAGCESVRLFAERAAATVPGFTVTGENAAAIAQIAHKLDGLPLAIELAAARVKLLPPEAILARLEHSLGLLTGGRRDLPDRLQTLRATIGWSYDLLTAAARRLLAACSVFAGGASLEAIEAVCGAAVDIGLPVLDALQELVDQSLLRQAPGPGPSLARYVMLETVREYAAERLAGMPEADQVRGAHAAAFLALVEAGGRPHAGLARKEWLERLETEHNNIRAALDWYQRHDPRAALHLAASMAAFWSLRGHHTEGRQRLAELLGLVAEESTARVSALNGAAWLAIDQGDYAVAERLLGDSSGLSRALGDKVGEGIATVYLGRCKLSSLRIAAAVPDVERAVALVSEAADRPAIAFTMPVLRPGRAVHRPARSRLRPLYPLHGHGGRAGPGPAERACPGNDQLPPAGPGQPVSGPGGTGGGAAGVDGDRRSLVRPDRAGWLRWAGSQDRAPPAGAPPGWSRRCVPGRERVLAAGANRGGRRPLAGARPGQRRGGSRALARGGPAAQPGGGGAPGPGGQTG
jgi:non-specific serine/threonine protein kinase